MLSPHQSFVIINPAIELPRLYIDNPVFNFYSPAVIHNTLRGHVEELFHVDAFLDGEISMAGDRLRLGCSHDHLVGRILDCRAENAILYYSSFLRCEGLLNPALHRLINDLSNCGINVFLADMYDSATHYLDYNPKDVCEVYPALKEILKGEFPFHQFRQVDKDFFPRFPVEAATDYVPWLAQAVKHNLIKDNSNRELIFPYLSSTGCQYDCLFCSDAKGKWNGLSEEEVLNDLSILKESGLKHIYFTDPYSNYDLKRFRSILQYCENNNIRAHFTNGLGLNHIDDETALLISKTVDQLFVSPESLLDNSLKIIGKPFTCEKIREKFHLLAKHNIVVHGHFILGIPGENHRETNLLLDQIWDAMMTYNIVPYFQIYNSRSDLHIRGTHCSNVYKQFSPESCKDDWLKSAWEYFTFKTEGREEKKIIINVSYRCNNKCIFCAVGDRARTDGSYEAQVQLIRDSYKDGIRLLDIDGGEPLLYDRLFDLLDAAHHYSTVNITTNGMLLAYKGIAQRLSTYSNLNILISLHSSDEEIQNYLTSSPGSFRQTCQGIKNAVKVFDSVGVNCTLTSCNYKTLVQTAELVASMGVSSFNVQWYTPFGNVNRTLCPPEEAMRYVSELLNRFGKRFRIQLINFTYCQDYSLAAYMVSDYYKAVRKMQFVSGEVVNLSNYLGGQRYKDSDCETCSFSTLCRGHWDYGPTLEEASEKQLSVGPGTNPVANKEKEKIKLLDIIPGYGCNRNCIACTATEEMRMINLSSRQLLQKINQALALYQPENIRIGGGEPTVRKDLPQLIAFFKKLQPSSISIQSNGLMLSYASYLDSLCRAGLTKVNISIPALGEDSLHAMTGIKDSQVLLQKAVKNIIDNKLDLEIDILISTKNIADLTAMVDNYSKAGVKRFNFWFISIDGKVRERVNELVPYISTAAKKINEIFDCFNDLDLRVFYIPYCFFPKHQNKVWHPLDENAYVVTPDRSFFLEKGEIDLGVFVKVCIDCSKQNDCFGIRKNYVQHFGSTEIQPM